MPSQSWQQGSAGASAGQRAAGTLFNTYTTAKTVINQQDLISYPPNYFQLGKRLRITVNMAISSLTVTPGTVTFQVMLGSIVVFTTGAIQLNATAHTLLPARLVVDLVCQLANTGGGGVVAKFMGTGVLTGIMFTLTAAQVDAVNTPGAFPAPATTPALGTAFDGTISQILDFWVGFSISNAANGVQVADYFVEDLN